MKIVILGAEGYMGWPTAKYLSQYNNKIFLIDNGFKRKISSKLNLKPLFYKSLKKRVDENQLSNKVKIFNFDVQNYQKLKTFLIKINPDVIIHFAEQPSAPYSMMSYENGLHTIKNNLITTYNILYILKDFLKKTHLIKLGTMGEYGTPNIKIEEGFLNINHKGRKDKFLYPRQASSLYHTSKIMDTDLIWFYVRNNGLLVTDLMQGPVYGISVDKKNNFNSIDTSLFYDEIFGTVLNRFIVQASLKKNLTIYGKGNQIRGFINLYDSMECIRLAILNPPSTGRLEVFNQFTEQFSINQLANKVVKAAAELDINIGLNKIKNPRNEKADHYYNASNSKLKKLGLNYQKLNKEYLKKIIKRVISEKSKVNKNVIYNGIKW
tara:strand:- start:115 stop:1251 length:1137 start_codon:yes stop_codon:yes gene_type:complete